MAKIWDKLAMLNKLQGWWRPWLIVSVCWLFGAAVVVNWHTGNYVSVHTEPYTVMTSLDFDYKSMRPLSPTERSQNNRNNQIENDQYFREALLRGYNKAQCWGKLVTFIDTESENGANIIDFGCFSKWETIKGYAKNIGIMLFVPVLVPLAVAVFTFLMGWIRTGFRERNAT